MGKPNWIQKKLLKFIGVDLNVLNNRLVGIQKDSIINKSFYGINALWNSGTFSDGIAAYKSSAALYSVVNRICRAAAIAPWHVYRIKDKKKHYKYLQWTGQNATIESLTKAMQIKDLVYEEDNSHALNKIIDNPNGWCKGSEFVINSIGFKLLKGNRYIRVISLDAGNNKGKPYELQLLPPQFVTIVPDGTLYGVAEYILRIGRYEERIPASEIIHSKDFNPDFDQMGTHLYGFSKIEVASKNLQRGDSGLNRSVAMLDNAGAAGLLYEDGTGGNDDDESIEYNTQLKAKINDEVLGVDNAKKIAVANKKMGYINFGLTAVEMNLIDLEKYSQEQICNIFMVPPGLLNPDKMSLNNAKEFKKEMLTSAVTPLLGEMRDDWNNVAARYKEKDVYVDYDLSVFPELQEDQEKLARVMASAWWYTGNEKRLMMGQDEDTNEPQMNTYLIPNNLTPIGQMTDNTQALLDQMNQQDNQQVDNTNVG